MISGLDITHVLKVLSGGSMIVSVSIYIIINKWMFVSYLSKL